MGIEKTGHSEKRFLIFCEQIILNSVKNCLLVRKSEILLTISATMIQPWNAVRFSTIGKGTDAEKNSQK